jgi:hypothetical protein
MTYAELKRAAQGLRKDGFLPSTLTPTERADWAYGNAVIENDLVTWEMARKVVAEQLGEK